MTINTASNQMLRNFIEDMTGDDTSDYDRGELQDLAEECERRSFSWFGETLTFKDWSN